MAYVIAAPCVDHMDRACLDVCPVDAITAEEAEGEMSPERTVAYLCGGPAMIEGCSIRLATLGLPPDAIRSERFVTG